MNTEHPVIIPSENVRLDGIFQRPKSASGLVIFVHGSGSSRLSVRNQHIAHILNETGLATLLFDLLTPEEETIDLRTSELRFNILFLTKRLIDVIHWCSQQVVSHDLPIGLFGASTGGAATLVAAAKEPQQIKAIVSRGGRPDLAEEYLPLVKAPTLLIVGGNDVPVIKMNQDAMSEMHCSVSLEIVPNATHLFEEAGALDQVAQLARQWFRQFLTKDMK